MEIKFVLFFFNIKRREKIKMDEDTNPIYNKEKDFDVKSIVLMVVAAIITSIALAINDTTNIVGAMIISPLIRPLYGVMIGFLNKDGKLFVRSLLLEVLLFAVTFIVSAIIGIILTVFSRTNCEPTLVLLCWPTAMMFRIGSWPYLIVVLLYGCVCGVAAALAYDTKTLENFIGVAISIALVPPICNAAMMLIYGSFGNLININGGLIPGLQDEIFTWMGVSFLVFLISVVSLLATGTITFIYLRRRKSQSLLISSSVNKEVFI